MTPDQAAQEIEELMGRGRYKVVTIIYDLEEETIDLNHTGVSFCEALGMVRRAGQIMEGGPAYGVDYQEDTDGDANA